MHSEYMYIYNIIYETYHCRLYIRYTYMDMALFMFFSLHIGELENGDSHRAWGFF